MDVSNRFLCLVIVHLRSINSHYGVVTSAYSTTHVGLYIVAKGWGEITYKISPRHMQLSSLLAVPLHRKSSNILSQVSAHFWSLWQHILSQVPAHFQSLSRSIPSQKNLPRNQSGGSQNFKQRGCQSPGISAAFRSEIYPSLYPFRSNYFDQATVHFEAIFPSNCCPKIEKHSCQVAVHLV